MKVDWDGEVWGLIGAYRPPAIVGERDTESVCIGWGKRKSMKLGMKCLFVVMYCYTVCVDSVDSQQVKISQQKITSFINKEIKFSNNV